MWPFSDLRELLAPRAGINPARSGVSRVEAVISCWRMRAMGGQVEEGVQLALQCRLFGARSIRIGAMTEVLRNSTIDASARAERVTVSLGQSCRLKENVWIASYGGSVLIGNRVLIGRNSVVHGHGGVSIGDDTMLGPGCMIFSSEHIARAGGIFQDSGHRVAPTVVSSNVWLGAGVVVTAGSFIESSVVVAAGSVVRGRLTSGAVYGGVPARHLKFLE